LKMNLHVHHLKRRRDLGSGAADNLSASRFELYCPNERYFHAQRPCTRSVAMTFLFRLLLGLGLGENET
jgi:hypothetical protein